MINLKRKDAVADAVKSILQTEETDVNDRTKDVIGGRKKSDQKDDVGPASDGKSTKVRLKNEAVEKKLADTKPATVVKNEEPEPREKVDTRASKENKTLRSFKERYEAHSMVDQMINEVLSKDASAGAWIHDFVNSDNPKFAGKSKEQRKKQALAAYYAKQRNEETELDEALKGNQHKLDKNKNNKIDAEDFKLLRKEEQEQVEEGWDDMLKSVRDKNKPQPNGGSGIKRGSSYGGGKQKDTPEQDEDEPKKKVSEGKGPETDNVPFLPPYNTTSSPETKDKSGAVHTPMSRAKHLARLAMGRLKKDLGSKGK